ncbi:hypothetical protein [Desulfitobacterium metallireducens]|uniref:Uncharacterized protein n=1 Tax=Desulfitobacterium metallireducens DSM 15288 TaxID=871968 RepID=W0E940_9FIRM|nr:hypothetical protein [Desulfitobacterium metallireducens]AHF05719.1 hypothetical protein DESME_00300 [Desulfitobacterium metallireducens DSM 15288]
MFVLKVCQACDRVLGELEVEDLTTERSNSIINFVGNVAYALCPDCLEQLEMEKEQRFH